MSEARYLAAGFATHARVVLRASVALVIAGVACGGDATAPVCSGQVTGAESRPSS
jgi:hypothetical protein